MTDIKWIKIATDIFDDEKILLIESMPEADSILVIWLKLLTLAGKQNNGGVFLMNDRIPYTDEMLATIFRRPINTVRLALQTFASFGMIEIVQDTITIPNWEKHQNIDALDNIREKGRQRVARFRDRQRQALKAPEECNATGNVTVTLCNAIDKDKEEEKEKELEEIRYIVGYLNDLTGSHYKPTTDKTKSCIRARLREGFTVEDFETVIRKMVAEWGNDPKMARYLRPETLFGNKFEGYLNQPEAVRQPTAWEVIQNA